MNVVDDKKFKQLRPKTRKVITKAVAKRFTEIVPQKGEFTPVTETEKVHVHNEGRIELQVRYLHNRAICAISGQVIYKPGPQMLEASA